MANLVVNGKSCCLIWLAEIVGRQIGRQFGSLHVGCLLIVGCLLLYYVLDAFFNFLLLTLDASVTFCCEWLLIRIEWLATLFQ